MAIGWMSTPNINLYLPALNAAEAQYGIPPNLLARCACEESNFRPDTVYGPANQMDCVGLMQLDLHDFPNAGKDWKADVISAAQLFVDLYKHFRDWQLVLAAYNDGWGNIDKFLAGEHAMPLQTTNYVGQIVADVWTPGQLVPESQTTLG